MAPKLLLTGGTGYIGGSVLHTVAKAHPEYEISVLLRKVPADFSKQYPDVKIIIGDYDSADSLTEAASKADIIIHSGNSDHFPSLNALIEGALQHYKATSKPAYLMHLSGTGVISDHLSGKYLGVQSPRIWSDIKDIEALNELPDEALHRNTEKLLFDTMDAHGDEIKIALMCPCDIYGEGQGPGKTTSVYVPTMMQAAEKVQGGRPFYLADGGNTRCWIHIGDLMWLYLRIVEAAAAGGKGAGWNKEGYYFASVEEQTQRTIAEYIGKIFHKLDISKDPEPVSISLEKLDTLVVHPVLPNIARYLFAGNSRSRPDRAKKYFGFEAKETGVLEELESEVLRALGK